jgi:hypothetical protein
MNNFFTNTYTAITDTRLVQTDDDGFPVKNKLLNARGFALEVTVTETNGKESFTYKDVSKTYYMILNN